MHPAARRSPRIKVLIEGGGRPERTASRTRRSRSFSVIVKWAL